MTTVDPYEYINKDVSDLKLRNPYVSKASCSM